MPHPEPHPLAGERFRISINGDVQAIYDQRLQGKIIRLEDWADRLEQNDGLNARQIAALLSLYEHRCGQPSQALSLDGVVYGVIVESIGARFEERALLKEDELIRI